MPETTHESKPAGSIDFIPAAESALFTMLFGILSRQLARLHFHRVWLRQEYRPDPDSRTLYFLNHTTWWDGLIPLLLNRYRLRQNGRAMMEERQMIRYPFFRKLGAFSVAPENRSHTLRSLRYAVRSMERPSASLFIYPEGEIRPFRSERPEFRNGVGWLCRQVLEQADIVPVGVYTHTIRHSRPELHIHMGRPVNAQLREIENRQETVRLLEISLQALLSDLESSAGYRDENYEAWI